MLRLPNALTVLRILLVPVFALAFMVPGETGRLSAFAIFCIAGISDVLDGFAARKLQASSELGRMLDPIADKILVCIALMMLVARHILTGLELVPALVILAREILVSGLREFLATASVSVPVTRVAKFKTVLQMISIGAMILGPSAEKIWPRAIDVAYALLWTAAALTVYTGLAYFRAGFAHVRNLPAAPQPRPGELS
ncbi:MAG TPA: CDP-diacylglycerol--glycerol-3-phosphate 3-phosphatidyltransferase [Rhizomicrobium sp.]|jgi:CDP-diacylglycerol--glycerol-3-phosphate 3-phosphatidyltransferase|nr:CDP-diacylglycerol--glycerol-3-phosphate 3-phosphatidyltransferase [Rhizomicrobium sp.]